MIQKKKKFIKLLCFNQNSLNSSYTDQKLKNINLVCYVHKRQLVTTWYIFFKLINRVYKNFTIEPSGLFYMLLF